jgi:molybdate/tungstate transport system substrate-binding protein
VIRPSIRMGMFALMFVGVIGCGTNKTTSVSPISVLYAGSLTTTMEHKLAPNFQKTTGVKVNGEGAGSSELAQEMKSGLRQPDVFISASPSVNETLLMGTANHHLVNWYLTFARDQLVIAYSPSSRFAPMLKAASKGHTVWYSVLEEQGFRLGRTDPKLDPKGASSVILCELAEKTYHLPGLANRLLGGSVENTKQVFPEQSLLAQLESGQMDAVIAYRHEAVDWKLPFVTLPQSINLGSPADAKVYARASVRTAKGMVTRGAPIVFTVTIPSTVTHQSGAQSFVNYLISGEGHALLMADGFTSMPIEVGGTRFTVPISLRKLIQGSYSVR